MNSYKEFRIKLTADNYLVNDHRIDGMRVLPGIAYLDIVARCLNYKSFELTQVTYPHAAKLNENETIILCVVFDERTKEIVVYHQIHDKKIIHFKALIEFDPLVNPNLLKAISIDEDEKQSCSMESIYSLARDSFIEHGEFMQILGTTQINAQRIRMELSLGVKAIPFLSRFYLHPALLDGATFAIAALHFDEVSNAGSETSYLPLGIDRVTVFDRITTPSLLIKAEVIPTNNDSIIKCRIQLFAPSGQLVVVLDGLTNKRFQRAQFSKQSNKQVISPVKQSSSTTLDKILTILKNNLREIPAILELQVSFFDLGLDSSDLIDLVAVLEQQFNIEFYPTVLFEQNTLEKLAAYIDSCLVQPCAANAASGIAPADMPVIPAQEDDALYIPTKGKIEFSSNNLIKQSVTLESRSDGALFKLIETILGIPFDQIKPTNTFQQLGFDSLTLTDLAESLSKRHGVQINPSQFFELQTIGQLQDYLGAVDISNTVVPQFDDGIQEPRTAGRGDNSKATVVICGYHCSFAQCQTPANFWQALLDGKDCTQMPATERFDSQNIATMQMGFINDYAHFDYDFFDLSLEQAKFIDPQQRKLLELSWHVFEQSGVSPLTLKGRNIGVFVAIQFDDYARLLDRSQLNNLYQITGCAKTFAANRISHYFDFHGASETIDTACSSSFSALNRAVQAINSGQCESALVLGVSLICDAKTLELTRQLNILSPTNCCRPFDAKADGYVKGEGLAGLWLVSKNNASEQGLRISAGIEALQVNHGGSSQSLTAPNPMAQKQLLAEVYNKNGLMPNDIDYFEAHATATLLGDPIEFSVLEEIFRGRTAPLHLGSVKSNIGHTEPVAGLAGIIKGLLMLEHQMIPPQTNFHEANPYIALKESTFEILQQGKQSSLAKIAINSFGFGGSNGHCVLTKSEVLPHQHPNFAHYLIKLSAKNEGSLDAIQQQLRDYLNASSQPLCLARLSFTLNVGRADFTCRRVFVVQNIDDLKQQLSQSYSFRAPQTNWANIKISTSHQQPLIRPSGTFSPFPGRREEGSSLGVDTIEAAVSQQALIDFQQSAAQLKLYLGALAHAYQQGQTIEWNSLYLGMTIVPLALPVYPFVLTPCWFEQQVKSPAKMIDESEDINIDCYQQIWSKKEATTIDLSHYRSIAVFLTCSQQEWVKQEFEQAGCTQRSAQTVHYVLVDDVQDFERGLKWLEGQSCELIYYFAGMVEVELTTSSLLDSQKRGIKPFLALIRKLHQSAYADKKLTLYVYSNNAYAFNDYPINPFAASLHGLAQTLKNEYPTWLIECIDIVTNIKSAHNLTISSLGQAYPLVLANNGVWHRQLEAVEMSLAKHIFHDEVLVLIGGDGQVGKLLVPELIKDEPKAIIIASRHTPLRKEGILRWRPLDCSDLVAVDLFIEEIICQYGKIDCLYHLGSHYAESPLASLSFYDYLMQMCAKVLGSFHLIKTCEDKAVTQVVITSSVQVYTQNKNRGAYSAACFYADSVVAAMQSEKTKLVHWGFWQQENDDANKMMASIGILPITAKQGYHALQFVAGSSQPNISFFNVTDTVKALMPIASSKSMKENHELLYFNQGLQALEHFCFDLVKHQFVTKGVVWSQFDLSQVEQEYGLKNDYAEYFVALISQLKDFEEEHYATRNIYQIKSRESLLQARLELTRTYPQIVPFINLLSVCTDNLMAIFKGQRSIQQIMFPYGRDNLVRPIYQGNILAKHYNQAIATLVEARVVNAEKPLDILELGAGTGATTEAVLTQCQQGIHYVFSDINPQFVKQAKEAFANHACFEACILDINEPVMSRHFDVIIASNVLHTTDDIRQCLMGISSLLRDGGLLVINEATANSLFLAATFGLFKQWHANKDGHRIKSSALLTPQTWQSLLEQLGFNVHIHPMPNEVEQSIFVAHLNTRSTQNKLIDNPLASEFKTAEKMTTNAM